MITGALTGAAIMAIIAIFGLAAFLAPLYLADKLSNWLLDNGHKKLSDLVDLIGAPVMIAIITGAIIGAIVGAGA